MTERHPQSVKKICRKPGWSAGTDSPITLCAPEYVELDDEHRRMAIEALVDLIRPILRDLNSQQKRT